MYLAIHSASFLPGLTSPAVVHCRDLEKATTLSNPAAMFLVFRSLMHFCNAYPQVSCEYLLICGKVVTERNRFLAMYYRIELFF